MGMIKGIDVVLTTTIENGLDPFGEPIRIEKEVIVHNVLVAPNGSSDVLNIQDIDGKKIAYILAIPKGDTHNWTNKKVSFFNQTFKTVGLPQEGIESLIPLDWNKKVYVERYE